MRQNRGRFGRRRLLVGVGAAVAVGLAGCSGGGDGNDAGTGGDGGTSGNGGTGGDGGSGGSDGGVEVPDLGPAGDVVGPGPRGRVDEFLADARNYGGTIGDATGTDEVTVAVGAEGNGGYFAFDPPAVAVSPDTTVSWRWTGRGGQHNVVSQDPSDFAFDSGTKVSGDPFERSFGGSGVGLYVCTPHLGLGMKGAVVVVPDSG